MARVSYSKIINTNNFKYLILALIVLLTFGTCHKCLSLFSIKEGNAKSTDADGDTKSDSSGNKKKTKKHWYPSKNKCKQMTDAEAKKIWKQKGASGKASIKKVCDNKYVDCYKCITNNKCHGDC